MKTCDAYQEFISAYIDGETANEETSAMFSHLGGCPDCRSFMRSALQLQSLIRENPVRATAEIHSAETSLWKRKFAISYPLAAVIALLMLVSSALFFSRMKQPPVNIKTIHTEYVYLTSFPPVYIIGSRSIDTKPN